MEVKGIGIKTTREFVKKKFPEKYQEWINSLPQKSKTIYNNIINVSEWYPMNEAYHIPVEKISELFYDGDTARCGDEIGMFSAELALTGIYKVFVLITNPNFLVRRASQIFETYYRPCEVMAFATGPNSITLKINAFSQMIEILEYRIGGWCKKALEFMNCKNITYQIEKSIGNGDNVTTISLKWD